MKTKLLITLIVIFFFPIVMLSQETVNFETLSIGTKFGNTINSPGDVIFTQDDISVSVQDFYFDATTKHFGSCEVVSALPDFGAGNLMSINNINLLFDFTNIPTKTFCKFEFADFGGFENLKINGHQLFIEELTYNTLGNPAPDVTLYYSQVWTPQGYIKSSLFLYGQIQTLLIGGQEFFLDNIKLPAGGGGQIQKYCVDFESLTIGDRVESPAFSSGDFIFEENFIPVTVHDFYLDATTTHFGSSEIVSATPDFGTGNVASINNLNLQFDFNHFGATNYVTFECADYGGLENFQVNGGPIYIGELKTVSGTPTPGVSFYISATATHFLKTKVLLFGNIFQLKIGGQEFMLDNVCAFTPYQTNVDDPEGCVAAPKQFELNQNYPNPFNPETTIPFSLNQDAKVTVKIFNVLGQEMITLLNRDLVAGKHLVQWDGTNKNGINVASGVYFYQVETNVNKTVRKMMLMR